MLELLLEIAGIFSGRPLEAKLPDCGRLLSELKAGKKIDLQSAERYLVLCRLTIIAMVVRWIARVWLGVCVFVIIKHISSHLTLEFQPQSQHQFAAGLGLDPQQLITVVLHCQWVAYASIGFLVMSALGYNGLARLSQYLAAEYFPPKGPIQRVIAA
jgi:hypothetical protein